LTGNWKLATANLASPRQAVALAVGGAAVVLRMASDWLPPGLASIATPGLQAALLALGVALLNPEFHLIFLRGGEPRRGLAMGILFLPFALVMGLVAAQMRFGGPQWPTSLGQVAGQLFGSALFTAIEELEFRGFLLAILLSLRMKPPAAVATQAVFHTLAHIHRAWEGNYLGLVAPLMLTLWFGWLTVRTRSLLGAWATHFSWNLGIAIPELGAT
jgi:membrane protease YdiL (CAAX protease family)